METIQLARTEAAERTAQLVRDSEVARADRSRYNFKRNIHPLDAELYNLEEISYAVFLENYQGPSLFSIKQDGSVHFTYDVGLTFIGATKERISHATKLKQELEKKGIRCTEEILDMPERSNHTKCCLEQKIENAKYILDFIKSKEAKK